MLEIMPQLVHLMLLQLEQVGFCIHPRQRSTLVVEPGPQVLPMVSYMDNNRRTCHTYFLSLTCILRQPILIESIIDLLPELLKLVGSLGLLVVWQVRFQKCVMLWC